MKPQKIDITYSQDGSEYLARLTVRSLDPILAAAKNPDIAALTGEALVAALVGVEKGNVSEVWRTKDSKRNDGAGGEPQYQEYDENGTLRRAERFSDDRKNNGRDGAPALVLYYANGKPSDVYYYTAGDMNDGPLGQPGYQAFDAGGLLKAASRYKDHHKTHDFTLQELRNYQPSEVVLQKQQILNTFASKIKLHP